MMYFIKILICTCILSVWFSCSVDVRDDILGDDYSYSPPNSFDYEQGEYTYNTPPKYTYVQEEVTWNASEENFIYELPPSVGTLHVNAPKNSQVFLVKMNPSLLTIPSGYTRYLQSSGNNRTASDSKDKTFNPEELLSSSAGFAPVDYAPARDFVPPKLPLPGSRSAIDSTKDYSYLTKEYEINTRRTFFTDDEKTREQATLHHKGEHCNIWVVDKYFTTEAVYGSGVHINRHSASYLGNLFDKVYPIVHTLFGKEQNFIKDRNNQELTINEKVNIIIYDIEQDGPSGGTVGFFWGKDFYTSDVYEDSNEGKFFYMDSSWVRSSIGLTASTLVHEFQHMINFSTKPGSATWYNEMLSMLCEDALHGYLGVNEERSPRNRLSMFCQGYWLPGLTNWLEGNNVLYSYAGAYAFGAFLIRNYGGINLLKEIATNSSVNQESITEALKKLDKSKTFDDVFREYVTAVLMWDSNIVNIPTFKKSIADNVEGYQFNLPAIDLGNYNIRNTNGVQTRGPTLLPAGIEGQINLQPYGFSLHRIGSTGNEGKLRASFNIPYISGERNFIVVK